MRGGTSGLVRFGLGDAAARRFGGGRAVRGREGCGLDFAAFDFCDAEVDVGLSGLELCGEVLACAQFDL